MQLPESPLLFAIWLTSWSAPRTDTVSVTVSTTSTNQIQCVKVFVEHGDMKQATLIHKFFGRSPSFSAMSGASPSGTLVAHLLPSLLRW